MLSPAEDSAECWISTTSTRSLVWATQGLAREVEKAEPDEERVEAEKDQLLREINLESSLIGFGWKP